MCFFFNFESPNHYTCIVLYQPMRIRMHIILWQKRCSPSGSEGISTQRQKMNSSILKTWWPKIFAEFAQVVGYSVIFCTKKICGNAGFLQKATWKELERYWKLRSHLLETSNLNIIVLQNASISSCFVLISNMFSMLYSALLCLLI